MGRPLVGRSLGGGGRQPATGNRVNIPEPEHGLGLGRWRQRERTRRRPAAVPGRVVFSSRRASSLESGWPEIGSTARPIATLEVASGALSTALENPRERLSDSRAWSYRYPQQVSKVNSLWSIEQCR